MRRIRALLIGLCLTGCSGQDGAVQNNQSRFASADMYVTEAHNGSVVGLRPGQSFEVRLPENLTSQPPVQWAVAAAPANLRLVGTSSQAATRTFRFSAIAEGDGQLILEARQAGRRVTYRVEAADDLIID